MSLSKQIDELIQNYFPIEDLLNSGITTLDQYYIANFYLESILILNAHLLSGGYLADKFEDHLNHVGRSIFTLFGDSFPISLDPQFISNVNSNLKAIIYRYYELYKIVKISEPSQVVPLKNSWRTELISSAKIEELFPKTVFQAKISSIENIFKLNLKISKIDHYFTESPEVFSQLLSLKTEASKINNFLSGSNAVRIHGDLLNKAILINKVMLNKIEYLIGLQIKRKKEEGGSHSFSDGLVVESLPVNSTFGFPEIAEKFNELDCLTASDETNSSIAFVQAIINKFLKRDVLNLFDFRVLVRLVSRDQIEYIDHEEIIKRFNDLYETREIVLSNYDKRVYNLARVYLLNNQLSYYIKHKKELKQIQPIIDEIKKYSHLYNISNFFIYSKICDRLLAEFNHYLTKDLEEPEIVQSLDTILNKFKENLNHLNEKFLWSKRISFIHFRETHNNCTIIIKSEEGKIKLFIASAYSPPLNYISEGDKINGLRALPRILEQQLENTRNLLVTNAAISTTKEKVETLKIDFEKSQKKHIEILSIFAAIVIFASGNIQMFMKVKSASEGLHFMFIFALCLSLFVLLVWVVFKDRSQPIHLKQWIVILSYFIVLLFAVFTFVFSISKEFDINLLFLINLF